MGTSNKTGLVLAFILLLVGKSSQQTTLDPKVCYSTLDLVMVIDGSNSLGTKNFNLIKNTTSLAVNVLTFGENSTRVGAVLYSSDVAGVIELKTNKDEFKTEVDKLSYPDGETYTNLGIDRAIIMLTASRRPEVPIAMMVLTDGKSTDRNATWVSAYKSLSHGIAMFPVGIGNLTDMDELLLMTDKRDQIFMIESFRDFPNRLQNLTNLVCTNAKTLPTFTIPTTTTESTTQSTSSTTQSTSSTTQSTSSTSTTLSPMTTTTLTTDDQNKAIELCKNSPSIGGVGYVLFPEDCTKVLQCYYNHITNKTLVVTRQCPSGQFWDQTCLKCLDSWKVDCPYDKCKIGACISNVTASTSYPMDGVCGGFWSCENGRSYPKCCPPCYSYMVGYGCKFGNTCFDRCGADVGCPDGLGVCEKIPEWANITNYSVATDAQGLSTTTCIRSNLSIVDCKCQINIKDTFMQEGQECKPYQESNSSLQCSGASASYSIKQNTNIGTFAIKIRINVNVPYFNITSAPVSAQGDNQSNIQIWADTEGLHASIGDISNSEAHTMMLSKNMTGDMEILVILHKGLFTLGVAQDTFQVVSSVKAKSTKLCTDCIHNFSATSNNGGCSVNKVELYSCKPEVTTIYVNS